MKAEKNHQEMWPLACAALACGTGLRWPRGRGAVLLLCATERVVLHARTDDERSVALLALGLAFPVWLAAAVCKATVCDVHATAERLRD
jgi:hypothetical protein